MSGELTGSMLAALAAVRRVSETSGQAAQVDEMKHLLGGAVPALRWTLRALERRGLIGTPDGKLPADGGWRVTGEGRVVLWGHEAYLPLWARQPPYSRGDLVIYLPSGERWNVDSYWPGTRYKEPTVTLGRSWSKDRGVHSQVMECGLDKVRMETPLGLRSVIVETHAGMRLWFDKGGDVIFTEEL